MTYLCQKFFPCYNNVTILKLIAFVISRPEKYGGDVSFSTYEDLEAAYARGDVYPLDLKNGVAEALGKVMAIEYCVWFTMFYSL